MFIIHHNPHICPIFARSPSLSGSEGALSDPGFGAAPSRGRCQLSIASFRQRVVQWIQTAHMNARNIDIIQP